MIKCCNSTYRSRYAPKGARQQRSRATMKSALLLPERSEGKTKVIRQQYLPFTVLKRAIHQSPLMVSINLVATAYGMRRRVRDSRGAKRRWSPHISYLSEARVKQRWWSNSTYRLRYVPKGARQQRSKATMRSALLLPERSDGKTKVIRQ